MLVKSVTFFVLFLAFSPPIFSQNNTQSEEGNAPEFWADIRQMPVQFLTKSQDKGGNLNFSAIFAGSLVVEHISFVLPVDRKEITAFFEAKERWEEKIDLNKFLKRLKKDYWLTTYLKRGDENILISAHQFKSWRNLKSSYASRPEQRHHSVDYPEFWQDIRMTLVVFYLISGEKIYWFFLNPIDKTEPYTKSDAQFITLTSGHVTQKRLTNRNKNFDFRILEEGFFTLQENTIFQEQEMESEKERKVLKLTIFDAKLRLRILPMDRAYFLNNYEGKFWICFYDNKFRSISRLVKAQTE